MDLYPRRQGVVGAYWLPVFLCAATLLVLATFLREPIRDRLDTQSLMLIVFGWAVLALLVARPGNSARRERKRRPVVSLTEHGVRLRDPLTDQPVDVPWVNIDRIFATRKRGRTTLWIAGSLGRLGPLAHFEIAAQRPLAEINAELQRRLPVQ